MACERRRVRHRRAPAPRAARFAPLVEGRLQSADGVQHLIADRLKEYRALPGALDVRSRDFRWRTAIMRAT
jgi:hypothetical protein